MKILLTGGGTAGHINPALAIAEIVLSNRPEAEIAFVGIRGGKEEDLVTRAGYPLHFVRSRGFARPLWSPVNLKAMYLALVSPYEKQTTRILEEFQPDLVIGTGGYACWPLMAAAARRGIPTALHESNAYPGVAVKRLQRRVDRLWINFASTAERLSTKRPIVRVGNPTLGAYATLSREEARRQLGIAPDVRLLLSFGGSLGAEKVNDAVLNVMRELTSRTPNVLHLHASGKGNYDKMQNAFLTLERSSQCILKDYVYDMPLWMAAADLVIARAGAMTLSELALLRKASILIPSPNVADNHQYYNAKALADEGAARLIEEGEELSETLTAAVRELLFDEKALASMGARAAAFADGDANRRIWQEITSLLRTK